MKLLFVASNAMESRGLLRRCAHVRPLNLPLHRSRAGFLGGHEILLTANGAGARRSAAAVDAALASFRPDALVSIGFCGALDPSLAIAGIVVGTTIFARERAFAAESPVAAGPHHLGPIWSFDHVAATAAEKRGLPV